MTTTKTTTQYVHLDGKEYLVQTRWNGQVEVYARWEAFNIADRNFVRASTITRTRCVDPNGRTGKKVLAALAAPLRERLCTPVSVVEAGRQAATSH